MILKLWSQRTNPRRAPFSPGILVVICLTLVSCDLNVTNPGLFEDHNLEQTAAHDGLVNGAMRMVQMGWSRFAQFGATHTRELQPSGGSGGANIDALFEYGLPGDHRDIQLAYNHTHSGRWIAEHAVERIREAMGSEAESYRELARAYLWAGIGNRVLGEHVCTAIFDGGPPEPYRAFFARAVEHFDDAERIAAAAGDEEMRLAATALRAAAHVHLDDWEAAASDASQIPFEFTFAVQFQDRDAPDVQFGGERYALLATFIDRGISFWHTMWEDYYPATGDPRAAWGHDPNNPAGTLRTAWNFQPPVYWPLKFYAPRGPNEVTVFNVTNLAVHETPINLATGREMQLIRAEAALVAGNQAEAMTLLNGVRQSYEHYGTGEPVEAVTAANAEEAWAALKRERAAELLLEGRRFGDRKRWAVNDTPGELDPMEYMPDNHVERFNAPKIPSVCFALPLSERDRNQNIPPGYQELDIHG